MAKQTFTTGQVLTAAQMTSLQQTAMGGGPATAKTANYVLVASDAGTTVAMNAAGATTITVNTGLFAAGDTVFIQNLGAGACTITAGTATVATAGSLILPQNDAGILYFTSASASIFYDYIQVGATSPLTTKGDLYTFGTSDTRLGVGADGTILVANSSETTGLEWVAPAAPAFVGAIAYLTNNQAIASTSETAVLWDNEIADTNTFHDNVTNKNRFTVPAGYAGKYLFSVTVAWQNSSTSDRFITMLKNGTGLAEFSVEGNGSVRRTGILTAVIDLGVGDFVGINAYQNSGGNLNVLGGNSNAQRSQANFVYLGA